MIVYSATPVRVFVAQPGDFIAYGQDERDLNGFGKVTLSPDGQELVNGHLMDLVVRTFPYVRKM